MLESVHEVIRKEAAKVLTNTIPLIYEVGLYKHTVIVLYLQKFWPRSSVDRATAF